MRTPEKVDVGKVLKTAVELEDELKNSVCVDCPGKDVNSYRHSKAESKAKTNRTITILERVCYVGRNNRCPRGIKYKKCGNNLNPLHS